MRLNTINSIDVQRFNLLLEEAFKDDNDLSHDDLKTNFDEIKNTVEEVVKDPDNATDDEIKRAILYYYRLSSWIKQIGPKLVEIGRVLKLAQSYKENRKGYSGY